MQSTSHADSIPKRRRWWFATSFGLLIVSAIVLVVRELPMAAQDRRSRQFLPVRVIPAQRAIKNAPVVGADRIRGQVNDSELVLGVIIKGEARAYPINMLTGPSREIINDKLGGQAIAATW